MDDEAAALSLGLKNHAVAVTSGWPIDKRLMKHSLPHSRFACP